MNASMAIAKPLISRVLPGVEKYTGGLRAAYLQRQIPKIFTHTRNV